MKVIAVLLFCVVAIAFAADPPRPVISEVFEALGTMEVHRNGTRYVGNGAWRVDQPDGKAEVFFEFLDKRFYDIYFLDRYDLKHTYEIASPNFTKCNVGDVEGKMPKAWGWISLAQYKGHRIYHHQFFDLWEYKTGGITLGIVVDKNSHDRPVAFERKTPTEKTIIFFEQWSTDKPQSKYFDVPKECNK
eukprot:TRINITY_DN17794_c0_g1_i1.p1 TRINITY_DN17794_c0_g1~~TRINITY_DN17794_c0_g1_i1.p1  ORF type:complete len:200 (-),score=36.70 TRINITY_DN17794_c0_g1_i1:72-638(-)